MNQNQVILYGKKTVWACGQNDKITSDIKTKCDFKIEIEKIMGARKLIKQKK